ncbi:MAG: zeta toxin family protein [Chloroflexi bacterium]|nr:zeta toxin family protein [Chloroflexota bacterium]
MKGDVILLQEIHKIAARAIVTSSINQINLTSSRFVISVAGESGSGKSETALAISNELLNYGINSIILGQDDYFYLPPKLNSIKRHEDPDWLGPHIEVNLDSLERNLIDAIENKSAIEKPLIDYNANIIESQTISLDNIKVIIAEGTYTSLLKHVDVKVFILRNWMKTLDDRRKRNRGNEVNDPFTENILATEHKIIAGHKYLADFVISDEFAVMKVK